MAATHEKSDVYQIITDRIIELLENGTAPWRKPWVGSHKMPINLVSKKPYQGINTFILTCSPHTSPYWLTFKQAKEKGGNVRKGEKGTPVIFWKIYEKEDQSAEDGVKRLPVLRYYTVFNADQCDGIEIPEENLPEWPEHERIERAEAIQLAMPNRPQVVYGGFRAFYQPGPDIVTVPELKRYEKREEFYSTLFHELAHSTGHQSRLNRDGVTGFNFFGDADYSKEELVAEMTAAFLCGHCGIENATIENSAAYINGWIRALKGDKKLAITAAAQAQKAANYILNVKPAE